MPLTSASLKHETPNEPLIFMQAAFIAAGSGRRDRSPHRSVKHVDYEGELGLLIGRRCHKMKDGESAQDYILGYTLANDVTTRNLQNAKKASGRAPRASTPFSRSALWSATNSTPKPESRSKPASTASCVSTAIRAT